MRVRKWVLYSEVGELLVFDKVSESCERASEVFSYLTVPQCYCLVRILMERFDVGVTYFQKMGLNAIAPTHTRDERQCGLLTTT